MACYFNFLLTLILFPDLTGSLFLIVFKGGFDLLAVPLITRRSSAKETFAEDFFFFFTADFTTGEIFAIFLCSFQFQ